MPAMATTLNKPAGISVFPLRTEPEAESVLSRLLRDQGWRADIDWPEGFDGGIVHRLDNATSGALLAADSLDELTLFRRWFAEHRFTKHYLLLAVRDVPWDRNVCDKPIAHHARRRDRMVVQRGQQTEHRGKWYPARTEFRRIRGRIFEAVMRSGVMHQIRVHAAFVGIPLTGDRLYGGAAAADALPDNMEPGLFCLHHAGMIGPSENNCRTNPVPLPEWATGLQYKF